MSALSHLQMLQILSHRPLSQTVAPISRSVYLKKFRVSPTEQQSWLLRTWSCGGFFLRSTSASESSSSTTALAQYRSSQRLLNLYILYSFQRAIVADLTCNSKFNIRSSAFKIQDDISNSGLIYPDPMLPKIQFGYTGVSCFYCLALNEQF